MHYFSIIVPLFNIKKNIEKIFSQHLKMLSDFNNLNIVKAEIIYVDNRSSDGTYKILKNKIRLNESFRLFKTKSSENNSPGLARNIGLKKAKGKYLLFLDADDQLILNNIKKITNLILQNTYTRIFLKKEIYVEKKKRYLGIKNLRFFLRKTNDTETIGIIFQKKKLLQNKIYFKRGFFEDSLFFLRHNFEVNNKDCSTNSIVYLKKKNQDSVTVSKNNLLAKVICKVKSWHQIDLYLKKSSPKFIDYNKILPDIQYRIRGEFYNELLNVRKSNLSPMDKSIIIKNLNKLIKKYVIKNFIVRTKKDLFIRRHEL